MNFFPGKNSLAVTVDNQAEAEALGCNDAEADTEGADAQVDCFVEMVNEAFFGKEVNE